MINVLHHGENGTRMVSVCVPHSFPPIADVIYGFIIPCLCIITIFSNSLAILVFTTTNRKSPTNIMLTVLAFSNMFSIGSISPMFFIVYGLKRTDLIYKCSFILYHDIAYYITAMFHCVSIWLTVVLGIERYIVVAFPMAGPRFCNRRNTVVAIVVISIVSFSVMTLPNMWLTRYMPAGVNISSTDFDRLNGHSNSSNFSVIYTEVCECWDRGSPMIFRLVYNWMRTIFGTTIPCVILLVTTTLLILELKRNNLKIRMLHFDERTSEKRVQKRMKRTSKLIVAITACFLLIELPNAVIFTWITVEPHPYNSALDGYTRFTLSIILNIVVYVGCNANFLIFVLMSEYFRKKLKYFLCFKWVKKSKRRKMTHLYTSSCKSSHFI